jgi:lipid-A-disaccharide synthase
MPLRDIVIVCNSPGELSALVKPVTDALAVKLINKRITLVLTPCQYSSGREKEYCATLKGLDQFVSAEEYKNWMLFNRKPAASFSKTGVVLYLGGDLAYPVLIAKKLGYPAMAYLQDRIGWTGAYKTFFLPTTTTRDRLVKKANLLNKCKIVGNLMVDSVAGLKSWAPEKNVITFMPGSRDWQIKHLLPLYEKISQSLKRRQPDITFQVSFSPFYSAHPFPGARSIPVEEAYNSELVITIPGTNTARLAALGIPMLMLLPLHNLDVIPLEGLPHYIGKIPYLGSLFKKWVANTYVKRIAFVALPNILAKKMLVPEIRGIIDEENVADTIYSLLQDKKAREEMSVAIKAAMGSSGAAVKITEEINAALSAFN